MTMDSNSNKQEKSDYSKLKQRRSVLKREYDNIVRAKKEGILPEDSCKEINDSFDKNDPMNLPNKWNEMFSKGGCFVCQ